MTVSTQANKAQFNGAGSAGPFTFNFRFFNNSEIFLVKTSVTGVDSGLTETVDYALTGAGSYSGGSITLTSSLAIGEKLTVYRVLPLTQTTDLRNQGAFFAEVHEDVFDRLTMIVQQQDEAIDRALQLSVATPDGVDVTLPTPEANNIIGWDNTGAALKNFNANEFATVVSYGTAIADIFTGDGATTDFTLSFDPANINNLDVSVGGVSQLPGTDYTWVSGTTLTFTTAPTNGSKILARYMRALPMGSSEASSSAYLPAGTGAVATTVQAELRKTFRTSDYSTFAQAVTAATGYTLIVDSDVAISADTTVSVAIQMEPTGLFTVATGQTPTINGPFSCGLFQCFDGDGHVRVNGLKILPEWYGAKGDGATNDTAVFQKISDIYGQTSTGEDTGDTSGVTIVTRPDGEYLLAGLVLGANIHIEGPKPIAFSDNHLVVKGGITTLRHHPDYATVPMIRTNDTTAPQRSGGSDDGVGKFWSRNVFRNIYFEGTRAVAGTLDADAVRLHNSWGVEFYNCGWNRIRGFAVRAIDCNALKIKDSTSLAPIFSTTISDSIISGNQLGASTAGIPAALWIADGGAASINWSSIITDNIVFNQVEGTAFSGTASGDTISGITAGGGGSLTLSQLTDETPIMFSTAPTGANTYTTYFVKNNGTTIKIATQPSNVGSGTFVTGLSGACVFKVGADANFVVCGGVYHTINSNRFDQAYNDNVALFNCRYNTVSDNTIINAGLNNAGSDQAGMRLVNSYQNTFSGNTVDGSDLSGMGSKQTHGIAGDAGSILNKIDSSNKISNHSVSNISLANGWISDTGKVFIPGVDFAPMQGTPVNKQFGNYAAMAFDGASTVESAALFTKLPEGFYRFKVSILFGNHDAASPTGNVKWLAYILGVSSGTATNTDANTMAWVTTAPAQYVATETTTLNIPNVLTDTQCVAIKVKRDPSDAADTFGSDAYLIGIVLEQY